VVGADDVGASDAPDIAIAGTRDTGTGGSAPSRVDSTTYPAGLTAEGRAAFQQKSEEKKINYEVRLSHELTRGWLARKEDGPAEHTRDRVLAADRALAAEERQRIVDEVEAKIRAEVANELQQAADLRQARARRASFEWRIGAALIAAATTATTTMAMPGVNEWAKISVIAATAVGTLIARPRSQ
jgi:hypothetical protein